MKVACITAVAPIRTEPSHRAEMSSQLLFAETADVLEELKDFTKIRCSYDGYEGYVQTSQLTEITNEFAALQPASYSVVHHSTLLFNNCPLILSLASPLYSESYSLGKFPVIAKTAGKMYECNEENIERFSSLYLNTPYLWGGRSSFGIDCSGFCQQVFKVLRIKLESDAYQQATQGDVVDFLQQSKCGDLAFFDNEEGRITHVGIMLNNAEIIHASGRVRVDDIDGQGIINRDNGQRTHKLRIIKRLC
jgi:hypothetical protein